MQEEIKKLMVRIESLERWKSAREKQQIVFPLDEESRKVLNKWFMSITTVVSYIGGAAGKLFTSYIGKQDDQEFEVSANSFIEYSVNISTDYLTATRSRFDNNTQVYLVTENTAPAPLTTVASYFVINSNGLTFQLSATMAGAAINITSIGVGKQYIYFF